MIEVWKDIPGYKEEYQASNLGQIRSLTRQITQKSRWGSYFTRTVKGRILRPGRYTSSGHVSVVLRKGSNGSPVHQLVALTFIGACPEGQEVRHLNGDPKDNRLENLVYGSRTDNILDVYRIGKAWRKLTAQQAKDIKQALKNGEKGSDLAREYDISQQAISQIKREVNYWWV
ncbi:HNH endonuclease [Bacillus sp. CRN 9]|nr:HNH endonuclease [Bacillus sp. CRN 9]